MKFKQITPTIPTTDVNRSRNFYVNKVGLKENTDMKIPGDSLLLEAEDGTHLFVYQRPPSHAEHTLASITVDDMAAAVEELSGRGVKFEIYDFPGLKTDEKGIAEMGGMKSAWFKDPDENIIGLIQLPQA